MWLTVGIAVGTVLFYWALVKWKWCVKEIVLAGFFSFLLYQTMLYFLIGPSTEKYMLYLPVLFKGGGGESCIYLADLCLGRVCNICLLF